MLIPGTIMCGALLAGIAASYGRELEAHRRPDRAWWIRRLLILPMLAIIACAAMDLFQLSPSLAAFSAAMLSMGGYDIIRLIERRWLSRLQLDPHRPVDLRPSEDGLARFPNSTERAERQDRER
jgi:hypothetical protein